MIRRGFSLIEVMMALVILGFVVLIFSQTNAFTGKNQKNTRDWTGESVVLEKTIEALRSDYTMTQLQALNATWNDSSQAGKVYQVSVRGSVCPPTLASGFPSTMLAQVAVSVRRPGEQDSLSITTVLWVN